MVEHRFCKCERLFFLVLPARDQGIGIALSSFTSS